MKLESATYHHTNPQEHETKVIVHNDNTFILAKDNHFMIDMLKVDREAIKEANHGLTSHIVRKNANGASLPKQCLDIEDSINRKKRNAECAVALYSSPTSGFEMVVKEDFYSDKNVAKVELPKSRVCIEDDTCHIAKGISIDEGVQSSDRSLVDKKEVSPMESSISNQTPNDGCNETTRAVARCASVDELKYSVFDSSIASIGKDQASLVSVLHNDFDGKVISVGSFDNRVELDAIATVKSSLSVKVTENSAVQASVFCNDCDDKGSSVGSINSESNLATYESVPSNVSAEAIESPAVSESNVLSDRDEKGSSVSLESCRGKLDTTESVLNNLSPEVIESPEVPELYLNNDCDGKDFSASSDNCEGKLDKAESVVTTLPMEVTENQLPPSEEISTNSLQGDSSGQAFEYDQKQYVDGQKIQAISEEDNLASTPVSFPPEPIIANNNNYEETPANCKVPSGVITFSFDKEEASTSGRNENTTDTQQSEVVQNGPRTEEAMNEGITTSSRSSFLHLTRGESNLSGSSLLYGPVANSGHIPFSGSISLRSDSSTTSARSFAFPILQSEWNSSPVKMAKADRQHLRKHRSWKMGLLCCRF